MAKNFVQPGSTLTLSAPHDVSSGDGLLVGSLFAVASGDAVSGADVEAMTEGVFDLAKTAAQAWAQGDKVYWDAAAEECTTSAPGNVLVGVAVADAADPSGTGRVLIGNHPQTELPTRVLTGTATIEFASIAAAASEDQTITIAGAALGDTVALGLPAASAAGIVFAGFVSAADTVTVRATNITAGAIDPASAEITAMVFKL
ncbi:MAG TPA: capsid cement protein [Phycisphaerae bacterium]|nr:capsid cement protein [Phycisphaerae bacterium]